jgi:AhpD family alkylhydroperoxidase
MSTVERLAQQEKELIAVGAAIAAGCRPCTTYHVQAAWTAGATDQQLRRAANHALGVRRGAADLMESFAAELLGAGIGTTPADGEDLLLSELVAVSAGYAVNCPTCVSVHMAEVKRLGGATDHIRVALGMARAVKHKAEQHAQAAWDEAAGFGAAAAGDTGCGPADDGPREAPVASGCGCGAVAEEAGAR